MSFARLKLVYEAITKQSGLAGGWTNHCEIGSTIEFHLPSPSSEVTPLTVEHHGLAPTRYSKLHH
jgi:NADPH-dependent ferric siderophore reductase